MSHADAFEDKGCSAVPRPRLDQLRERMRADFPPPLAELIWQVVRKTRLRRYEKVGVTEELIDYFREGLDQGATAEELVETFGDPRQAAKLIRRAKFRCRPLADRVCLRFLQTTGAVIVLLILLYAALALYFMTGEPTIRVDYIAKMNEPALAAPEDDRAWPLYRQALLQLEPPPASLTVPKHPHGFERLPYPGDEDWPESEAYLNRNAGALVVLERATKKPALGFIYESQVSDEDRKLWPELPRTGTDDNLLRFLYLGGRLSPFLKMLAPVITLDARRAALAGDSGQLFRDIRMVQRMAEHLGDSVYVYGDRVHRMSLDLIGQTLADHPSLLTDEQLKDTAHAVASFHPRADFSRPEMYFRDLLQRLYTDDGDGDGRLTPAGYQMFHRRSKLETGEMMLSPLVGAVVRSRGDMLAEYQKIQSGYEALSMKPLWEMRGSEAVRRMRALEYISPVDQWRLLPIMVFLPPLSQPGPMKELAIGHRDAILTAIAMELYRRRHGDWPRSLDDLAPSLLPEVPLDRFTGEPLRYKIIDGRPLLYSVGPDGDDDAGRSSKYDPRGGGWFFISSESLQRPIYHAHDGDWVLWPAPRE